MELQLKDTPRNITNAFIELLSKQDFAANGYGVTHFRMSNFREATEWVNNDHLTMLGRRVAKGL